jgi:hypothetical protein
MINKIKRTKILESLIPKELAYELIPADSLTVTEVDDFIRELN